MKLSIVAVVMALFLGGCSNTWEGVKDDSSKIWKDTKEAVHEATE
ncbi:entericidin EcnAB [Vibrio hannami]|nr:entericidin EcnAB [Vibrio hannami]MDG3086459.1 entericidin EcnAB [Vibrio hannami]